MTFGEAIRAVLVADLQVSALVSGKVFPEVAPETARAPFIVYTVVDDVPANTLAGTSDFSNARIQVDCYATAYLVARELARRVTAALSAASAASPRTFSCWRLSGRDLYDDEAGEHRVSSDFSLWMKEN